MKSIPVLDQIVDQVRELGTRLVQTSQLGSKMTYPQAAYDQIKELSYAQLFSSKSHAWAAFRNPSLILRSNRSMLRGS